MILGPLGVAGGPGAVPLTSLSNGHLPPMYPSRPLLTQTRGEAHKSSRNLESIKAGVTHDGHQGLFGQKAAEEYYPALFPSVPL